MSALTVSKKEIKQTPPPSLDRFYGVTEAYGVPVLVVDPAGYEGIDPDAPAEKSLRDIFQFIRSHCDDRPETLKLNLESINNIKGHLEGIAASAKIFDQTLVERTRQQLKDGEKLNQIDYPKAGVVLLRNDAYEVAFDSFEHVWGSREQHMDFIIEHEFAHLIYAGEPQADMITALKSLQKYNDPKLVSTWADRRAVYAVNVHRSLEPDEHDWTVTDGDDYINALSPDFIANLTEEEIINARMQKFSNVERMVRVLYDNLNCERQFKTKNWPDLARHARNFSGRTDISSELQQVSARFALAALRLSTEDAYCDPEIVEDFFDYNTFREVSKALKKTPLSLIYDENTFG